MEERAEDFLRFTERVGEENGNASVCECGGAEV
jgi:hypothetical protein